MTRPGIEPRSPGPLEKMVTEGTVCTSIDLDEIGVVQVQAHTGFSCKEWIA